MPPASTLTVVIILKTTGDIYRIQQFYDNGSSNDQTSAALLLGSGDSNQAYGNIVQDNYRDKGLRAVTARPLKNLQPTRCTTIWERTCIWRYRGNWQWDNYQNNIAYDIHGVADFADSHGVQTPTFANNHCTNTGTGCAQPGDPLFADLANRDLVAFGRQSDRGAGTPYVDVNISWPFVPDIGAMLDVRP
jgi:hypothetical protein